ncbi:unannotated protein [freshwater metagenome]|uniref:Unannotated protein n=1 Tax=freshwater metagenome TaxID=449393 RepID=A0A6J6V952_9ZZZZ
MKAAVQLDVVHSGDAEHRVDAVFAREQINNCLTNSKLVTHDVILLSLLRIQPWSGWFRTLGAVLAPRL